MSTSCWSRSAFLGSALVLTVLLPACARQTLQRKGGFTVADDPHLFGPGKTEIPQPRETCPGGVGCPEYSPAPPPVTAAPPLAPPPAAPVAPVAPPAQTQAVDSIATLDPDKPMPKQGVSTNATLVLDQPNAAVIDARSDLFSSGLATPDVPRGGVMPAIITLAPSAGFLVVSDVRGRIGCKFHSNFEADGGNCAGGSTAILAADHVSGLTDDQRTLFLSGVFLSDQPGAPPAGLDFSDKAVGMSFAQLTPGLGQSFFIGDGLTGSGSGQAQRFVIPSGATRLYLGIVDASVFHGSPGYYADNTGSMAIHIVQHRQ